MTEPFIIRSLLKGHLNWLVRKNFQVHIICSRGADIQWLEAQGVSVYIIDIIRQPNMLKDLRAIFQIYKLLNKINPDIVHYSTPKSSFLTAIALFFSNKKSKNVYTVRGRVYEDMTGVKKSFYECIDKFNCMIANKVLFISHEIKDDFINNKLVMEDKTFIAGSGSSNGFDTTIYRNPTNNEKIRAKKRFGVNDFNTVILFSGRLAFDKGINDLLIYFKKLSSTHESVCLLLVGKDEIDIKRLIHNYSLDPNLIFIFDWIADITDAYWASDILVFPSFREGFGNVCVESILCGVPVICYDVIGCRESVLEGVSGFLVPKNCINSLIEKTLFIINNEEEKLKLIHDGSIWARANFQQKVVWNDIYHAYDKLLNFDD